MADKEREWKIKTIPPILRTVSSLVCLGVVDIISKTL